MDRHALHAQRFRNERKRLLFENWVRLGTVQVFFDSTHPDVQMPENLKGDVDCWLLVTEAELYTSHFEGTCNPPDKKTPAFQYSVAWDSVHSIYSYALHEKHNYLEDVKRAAKRQENRQIAQSGKPLPC